MCYQLTSIEKATPIAKLFDSSHKFIVFFIRNLSKEEKASYAKEEAASTIFTESNSNLRE